MSTDLHIHVLLYTVITSNAGQIYDLDIFYGTLGWHYKIGGLRLEVIDNLKKKKN